MGKEREREREREEMREGMRGEESAPRLQSHGVCTFVLPVNESRFIFLLLVMASPTSAPPHTVVQMAGGRLLATRTLATIFDIAIEVSGVVGAPFLRGGHL